MLKSILTVMLAVISLVLVSSQVVRMQEKHYKKVFDSVSK
jgi:hypothetical protein